MTEAGKIVLTAALSLITGVVAGITSAGASPVISEWTTSQFADPTCDDPRGLQQIRPDSASASSTLSPEKLYDKGGKPIEVLTYGARQAIDGSVSTGWAEGAEGLGQGEWLSFDFPSGASVKMLCVANGYARNWRLYAKNPRARAMTLTSKGQSQAAVLTDKTNPDKIYRFQHIILDPPIEATLRLTIDSVYPGTVYTSMAISEIEFWGNNSN
jgi:hypothetical protein